MKKTLDTNAVLDELRASSAFFRRPKPSADSKPTAASPAQDEQVPHSPTPDKDKERISIDQNESTSNQKVTPKKKQIRKLERKQASLQTSNEETMEESILAALAITPIKPNTFRYSIEELDFVRDVVYEAEVKYKTKLDKNDVVRIALEWLMADYQQNAEDSLLAKILASKKARL